MTALNFRDTGDPGLRGLCDNPPQRTVRHPEGNSGSQPSGYAALFLQAKGILIEVPICHRDDDPRAAERRLLQPRGILVEVPICHRDDDPRAAERRSGRRFALERMDR